MKIRICTPVTGDTFKEFMSNLKKTFVISDFIEYRIDGIGDFCIQDLNEIKKDIAKDSILTLRSKKQGGKYNFSDSEIISLLNTAKGFFKYIDMDIDLVKERSFKCDIQTRMIISYHNFKETPKFTDLKNIINGIKKYDPYIIKIATKVNNAKDILTLFRLLDYISENERRIVIGMGKKGQITRLIGPFLGSYLTYASTDYCQTAPGQINISKMRKIYKALVKLDK